MSKNKHISQAEFRGDPNLGLYGFATDEYCLSGVEFDGGVLDVPLKVVKVMNTGLVGMFVCGNSHGVMIPRTLEDYEIKKMENIFDNVLVLDSDMTALGNLCLINDKGIVLSPMLKKNKEEIEDFFGLDVVVSTVAKLNVVGSVAFCTNKGCITHPQIRDKEKKSIEKILDVKSNIGTVNFGSPFPGTGILANSSGFLISSNTTGPELGRIDETLGFL